MHIGAVVADANVLLSVAIGKAAFRVIHDFDVQVHVCEYNVQEVQAYLPRLAAKYDLDAHVLALHVKILPIHIHPLSDYKNALRRAQEDIEKRDPDDAHVLALARALKLPIWSNDRDLMGLDVACYPTAKLLQILQNH